MRIKWGLIPTNSFHEQIWDQKKDIQDFVKRNHTMNQDTRKLVTFRDVGEEANTMKLKSKHSKVL